MNRLGSLVLVLGFVLGVVWAGRQAARTAGSAVDASWAARHNSHLRRVLNVPPSVKLEFKRAEAAAGSDFTVVVFEVEDEQRRYPLELYVSRDGRRVLYDNRIYDVDDPFSAIREQIRLDNAPGRGPAEAPLTIVEYSDYTCVYCRRFFLTLEKPLFERYPGQLRLVYKHFPLAELRSWSEDVAVAAACAFRQGNKPFWALHEKLFPEAPRLREGRTVLLELAQGAGLNLPAFRRCLDGRDTLLEVARDVREGERLGVQGTPTFFINGRPVPGLLPPEHFFQIVDEELAAAESR